MAVNLPTATPTEQLTASEKQDVKRKRKNLTKEQLEILESVYIKEKYPHMDDRIKLEKSTNLSEDRIQVWFQNRRAKDRKKIEAERLQHYFENSSRINEDFTLNNVKEERSATKNNTSGDVSDNER